MRIHLEETMYIEFGTPKDSELVKHTWLYVNKQGGPDRRFNNNPILNGNRYGVIQFQIPEVLDLIVCFSNYKAVPELERLAKCIAGKNVITFSRSLRRAVFFTLFLHINMQLFPLFLI